MKKYIWIVIAVVLLFLGLIIAYTLGPADNTAASGTVAPGAKPH